MDTGSSSPWCRRHTASTSTRPAACSAAQRRCDSATETEISEHAGPFEVGAVPPLGPLLDALEILDGRLLEHDSILFSGGDHRHGVLIDPHDLIEVAQPRIADICEEGPGRSRR